MEGCRVQIGDSQPLPNRGQVNQAAFAYYPRLARVHQYVLANYAGHISLADAAGVAALERNYFSSYFHARVGLRFRDWLSHLRVGRAIELLQTSDLAITGVAFEVGFQDLRTFERAFKKCTGSTPRAFKASVRPDGTARRQDGERPATRQLDNRSTGVLLGRDETHVG